MREEGTVEEQAAPLVESRQEPAEPQEQQSHPQPLPKGALIKWIESRSEMQQLIIGVVFVLCFGGIGKLLLHLFANDEGL